MANARVHTFFTLTLGVALCAGAAASTPFDGVNWSQVVARDPALHVDSSYESSLGTPYVGSDGGGVFESTNGPAIVVGRAGGEWIAAVPLDTGGSIGLAGWLLYLPHVAKHIAFVAGSESLRFAGGKIVTVTETGGRSKGRGVQSTFSVHGTTVRLANKRDVTTNE